MKRFSKFIQEPEDLDEAVKIGSKVRIHAPGKDYHGKVGHVGEIRRGAFAKAPPSYTIDYREPGEDRNRSVMLPKEKIKLHKESVELDEASYRDSGYRNMLKASQKADKEADKIRAQAAKKKPVKEEEAALDEEKKLKFAISKNAKTNGYGIAQWTNYTWWYHSDNTKKYFKTAADAKKYIENVWGKGHTIEINESVNLDEVYQETANYLVSKGIELESLNEEQLDEIIGAVARGLKSTVVNKKGNFRFSTAGRADAAQKTADATKRKSDNIERLRKQRERLAKERERLQRLRQARNT